MANILLAANDDQEPERGMEGAMRSPGSRTYKLCLSDAGFDRLLDCHCRVGRVARSLLPYGSTLYVGLAIADDLAPATLAAEFHAYRCGNLIGRDVRFVGFTSHLAELTTRLRDRLILERTSTKALKVNRLYAAGLSCLVAASDEQIARAYERLREIRAT